MLRLVNLFTRTPLCGNARKAEQLEDNGCCVREMDLRGLLHLEIQIIVSANMRSSNGSRKDDSITLSVKQRYTLCVRN